MWAEGYKIVSIEIDSTNAKVGNTDNFIDLSEFIYNRHAHDKTMCVSVSEIDFVISIESFINSDDDRDKFLKLVKYNYTSNNTHKKQLYYEVTPTKQRRENYNGYNHNLQMIPLEQFCRFLRDLVSVARSDFEIYEIHLASGKVRPEKIESAQARINQLLDQSVIATDDARKYIINEEGKELDLSIIDIDELKAEFRQVKNKNLVISDLRKLIEDKLEIMLKKNKTRTRFAERFKGIIDEYNSGGSQNEDFYEKLLELMKLMKEEESRHVKEDLSEEELEIFDLLCKDSLTKEEEKKVKLAAKNLYNTLIENKKELFVVDWQNDPTPREKVRSKIISVLNEYLPESYSLQI